MVNIPPEDCDDLGVVFKCALPILWPKLLQKYADRLKVIEMAASPFSGCYDMDAAVLFQATGLLNEAEEAIDEEAFQARNLESTQFANGSTGF